MPPAGRWPHSRLCSVAYQKIGIFTTHTTMQYGHSAPVSYRLW